MCFNLPKHLESIEESETDSRDTDFSLPNLTALIETSPHFNQRLSSAKERQILEQIEESGSISLRVPAYEDFPPDVKFVMMPTKEVELMARGEDLLVNGEVVEGDERTRYLKLAQEALAHGVQDDPVLDSQEIDWEKLDWEAIRERFEEIDFTPIGSGGLNSPVEAFGLEDALEKVRDDGGAMEVHIPATGGVSLRANLRIVGEQLMVQHFDITGTPGEWEQVTEQDEELLVAIQVEGLFDEYLS